MRIKKKKESVLEGDLTPMIDMTFQLIAFFMVLVNFTQADQQLEIKLPDSELAKPTEEKPKHPVVLNMKRDGKIVIAGGETDLNGIGLYLGIERDDAVRRGLNKEDVTVIIRAHEEAKTGDVQALIRACQDNDLETFALRVKERIQ